MCGLAGILVERGRAPVELSDLRRMAAMLRHRGPDGLGFYLDEQMGLAHTRLSIIDLAGGAQPLSNEDGSIWIAFNGEIFNYIELRATLVALGHVFRTQSDTEVIVHAYEQWGEQAWTRFNGQFAFALWDNRARRLWLVRDRLGILPLFYCIRDSKVLFASECKAIFASGHCPPRIDPVGLQEVLTLWAAPAPQTIFQDIHSVEPGSGICFNDRLEARASKYWQPAMVQSRRSTHSFQDAIEELEHALLQSVRLRLRADVPVGAYLSGGLDSSLLARLVRIVDTAPLQTFGIRFDDPAFDEAPHQRRMAALLGATHHEITCGPREIQDAMYDVVWSCETPLLRTAPAPLFLLSGLVRQHGMKVVLTGEGADEFFAGYDIFKEDAIRRFWARQPDSTARPALLSRLHPHVAGQSRTNEMWRAFFQRDLCNVDQPFYSHRVRWENSAWIVRFLEPSLRANHSMPRILAQLEASMPPQWRSASPLAQAQMIEIVTFLSPFLLCHQGDRPAMAHSVEARYPFLDPEVIDLASSLPRRCKLRGLKDKVLLRAVAARHLPREVAQRPKWAYRAPIASVLFGPNPPEYVQDAMSPARLKEFAIWDPRPIGLLFDKARQQSGRISEREEMALVGVLTSQILALQYLEEFTARAGSLDRTLANVRPDVFEDRRPVLREAAT